LSGSLIEAVYAGREYCFIINLTHAKLSNRKKDDHEEKEQKNDIYHNCRYFNHWVDNYRILSLWKLSDE
jgi:hypothetical protein